jgi:hypothetical protein
MEAWQGRTTQSKGIETMTTIKIETGNNESVVRGISKNSDGTFTAVTFSQSKTFKTLKGAQKWMAAKFR